MPIKKQSPLEFKKAVLKVIRFLEKEKVDYFLLGGLAVSVLGEPRFTYDLDLDIFLKKEEIPSLLEKAKKAAFQVNAKEVIENVQQFGTFRLFLKHLQVDFILASTEMEQSALRRRQKIKLFGKPIYFPSAEDLILLKVIPGRTKDLTDAESIVLRHQKTLDRRYLEEWARKICEEAEDFKIMRRLQGLWRALG